MIRAILDEQTTALWDILPHPKHSVVRWMARKGGSVLGGYSKSAEGLARVTWNLRDYNMYVQLNPTTRKQGVRCAAMDIEAWSFFVIDVDPISMPHKPLEASAFFDEQLRKLAWDERGMMIGTPAIIDSGRGIQLWYRLNDERFYDDEDKRLMARLAQGHTLKQLAALGPVAGCTVDTSCSDLPRVMRMPGSVNQKTGRQAIILDKGEATPWLSEFLLDRTPPLPKIVPLGIAGVVPWQKLLPHLTAKAYTFITSGVDEPGRHAACVAAAASLRDYGLDMDAAKQPLLWGASKCNPPLLATEVEPILQSVWKRRVIGDFPSGESTQPDKKPITADLR